MAYKRRQNKGEHPKLDMTPMIDVVFQLLIFFVVTLKQEDILSKLDVFRPAPDPTVNKEEQIETTTIIVEAQGFVFNGRYMARIADLDRELKRVASISTTSMILVKCTKDSQHGLLVQALDACSKYKLTKLSLFSM
ncbi:MAG: biopolymer transporter ExbD [Kiritimatiellaeota bacterium]|nr:biopolymer transporter ExbD [Kiritimatiellota bacterium]